MNSKALLFLAMLLASVILIFAESAPKDLDNKDDKIYTQGYYGGGPGYGGPWGGGHGGGWGGGHGGGWGGGHDGWGGGHGGGWGGGWGGGRWGGGGRSGWGGGRGWPTENHDIYNDAKPEN
ncbi:hypothetical protein TSUD_15890 [Trifolium subterraneum]|uniref:Glycine-rich protein n=1 Tax=Trifolium subterraneum TaxID=3900 RepID=A0A2Z6MXU2_TRISU|nr:hypothetical protein TSUD_15890 [Trifolium subterraneum]